MAVHIMVGVLIDAAGHALIAQRVAGQRHAGEWEFPGGKLEPGESRLAGLARELREELGISIESPRPLIRTAHHYPYGDVMLDVWVIRRFTGKPKGLDGQALRWCPMQELVDSNLLPADKPIVAALALPECLIETATDRYVVNAFGSGHERQSIDQLRGVLCRTARDAKIAARESTDFLVLKNLLPLEELGELCSVICLPIYAAGINLDVAWSAGATGISLLVQ